MALLVGGGDSYPTARFTRRTWFTRADVLLELLLDVSRRSIFSQMLIEYWSAIWTIMAI